MKVEQAVDKIMEPVKSRGALSLTEVRSMLATAFEHGRENARESMIVAVSDGDGDRRNRG